MGCVIIPNCLQVDSIRSGGVVASKSASVLRCLDLVSPMASWNARRPQQLLQVTAENQKKVAGVARNCFAIQQETRFGDPTRNKVQGLGFRV